MIQCRCTFARGRIAPFALVLAGLVASGATAQEHSWDNWGHNSNNDHHNPNSRIGKGDVSQLAELCAIDYTIGAANLNPTTQSTSAKPLIIDDVIYWTALSGKVGAHEVVRDENGFFVSCQEKWTQDVSDILGIPDDGFSEPATRSAPAFYWRSPHEGTLLYTGVANAFTLPFDLWFTTPPYAYALDAETGEALWVLPLAGPGIPPTPPYYPGDAFFPTATASPRVHDGVAYIGLASLNNGLNGPPFHAPLTFRGHMIALDLGVGEGRDREPHIKWTRFTVPERPAGWVDGDGVPKAWFAGGGVWASSPSIVPNAGKGRQGLVIFSSGQLYNYPEFTAECMVEPDEVIAETFSSALKGETGGGAQECLEQSTEVLKQMGIDDPIASNSVIALNVADGTFAWHVPTAGIDSWQLACGGELDPNNVGCNVPVVGPDWDIGGNSPVVVELGAERLVISHNKGGELFWIEAETGEVLRRADVCVGSPGGGTHWGFSYDPRSETLLVPCSGGQQTAGFGSHFFPSTTADGRVTCKTGYLNGIDVRTGQLEWQTLPAAGEISENTEADDAICPTAPYDPDERFKHGLDFDVVIKNTAFSGVPVNVMPDSPDIPLTGQGKAGSNGIPANSRGVVYWPVYYGSVYALDVEDGSYLGEFHCDEGAMYVAGPSVAEGYLSFGCGYGFAGGAADQGHSIMVVGRPQDPDEDE